MIFKLIVGVCQLKGNYS